MLRVTIDTWRAGGSHEGRVKVMVAHLVSYDLVMGKGRIKCETNCTCEEKTVDGLDESKRESQTYLAVLMVSQHPHCVLSVTNVDRGDGKSGNKFKVSGIMMAEGVGEKASYAQ